MYGFAVLTHGVDNDPKNNAGDPKRKDIGLKPLEPWIRVRHDANASLDEQPAGAGQKTANDRIWQEPNDSTEFEIPQSQPQNNGAGGQLQGLGTPAPAQGTGQDAPNVAEVNAGWMSCNRIEPESYGLALGSMVVGFGLHPT